MCSSSCDLCNQFTDMRSLVMTEVSEDITLFLCQDCDGRYDEQELYDIVQEMRHDAMVDRQVDDYLLTKTED